MSDAVKGPSKLPANPADRLRDAADALDDRPPFLTVHQDRATADLLRAMADGHNEACFTPEGECPEGIAAIALADTILGSDDE